MCRGLNGSDRWVGGPVGQNAGRGVGPGRPVAREGGTALDILEVRFERAHVDALDEAPQDAPLLVTAVRVGQSHSVKSRKGEYSVQSAKCE